jgi:hypothetical protein
VAPFWKDITGLDHVRVESTPVVPDTDATALDIYTGSVPTGTLTDHKVGGVKV